MSFRIPPQHRETVTVVRKSAYENGEETTVAEDVVCMIQPLTSGVIQRDATELRAGVAIQQSESGSRCYQNRTRILRKAIFWCVLIRVSSVFWTFYT